MPKRITEYEEATTFDSGDILLKAGTNGTKKITAANVAQYVWAQGGQASLDDLFVTGAYSFNHQYDPGTDGGSSYNFTRSDFSFTSYPTGYVPFAVASYGVTEDNGSTVQTYPFTTVNNFGSFISYINPSAGLNDTFVCAYLSDKPNAGNLNMYVQIIFIKDLS